MVNRVTAEHACRNILASFDPSVRCATAERQQYRAEAFVCMFAETGAAERPESNCSLTFSTERQVGDTRHVITVAQPPTVAMNWQMPSLPGIAGPLPAHGSQQEMLTWGATPSRCTKTGKLKADCCPSHLTVHRQSLRDKCQ